MQHKQRTPCFRLRSWRQRLSYESAEGKAEGEHAKAIDVAKTMLVKGFDVATIAEITNLQAAEIEALH